MRITIGMLMVVGVVVLGAGAGRAAERCGDADDSGAITVTDGVQILRAAAGLASLCTPARCDLDTSGSVSVTDGVNVLRAAAGLAVNLACPGPAPSCAAATVTVALAVPEPIGAATLSLAYPAGVVTLPGSGDAAAARVAILTTASLLNGGSPNDDDKAVAFTLIAPDGVDDGNLLSVRFDCLGAAPDATQFACVLSDVTAPDGLTPIAGATCALTVASD